MERPMNTASRDRVFHKSVEEYIRGTDKRRTPVSRVKLVKAKDGAVTVVVHSSRPTILRMEQDDIAQSLKQEFGTDREVKVQIVPEARAVAKYVRTSPRKARLILDAIKGKRVSEALSLLKFIPKHAAESIRKVLASAAANAQEGWQALPEELKIANFIADGGPILKRVRPRAQGRAYRILKRTSHLTVILTEMPAPLPKKKRVQGKPKSSAPKAAAAPAKPAKAPAKPAKAETAKVDAPVAEPAGVDAAVPESVTIEATVEEPTAAPAEVESPVAVEENAAE
jgi:large subunit ribosomal protein L22